MFKDKSSDKTSRRNEVLKTHNILMLLGDNSVTSTTSSMYVTRPCVIRVSYASPLSSASASSSYPTPTTVLGSLR